VAPRRRLQANRAHAIAVAALTRSPYVLLAGDLNDTPDSAPLQTLFTDGFIDIQHRLRHRAARQLPPEPLAALRHGEERSRQCLRPFLCLDGCDDLAVLGQALSVA
jgi:endonuclease/exonuclease/phosphatase family metal-dependent hydrolase